MNYSDGKKTVLFPYILGFLFLDIAISMLLGVITSRSISMFVGAMGACSVIAHVFFKKNNRLLNTREQMNIAFIELLVMVLLSTIGAYFLSLNGMKLSIDIFKNPYVTGIFIGIIAYKFIINILVLKGYNYLLRQDKNYEFDGNGNLTEQKKHIPPRFEGKTTQVTQELDEQLDQNKQNYHKAINKRTKKGWLINIGILLAIWIIVMIIITTVAKFK